MKQAIQGPQATKKHGEILNMDDTVSSLKVLSMRRILHRSLRHVEGNALVSQ